MSGIGLLLLGVAAQFAAWPVIGLQASLLQGGALPFPGAVLAPLWPWLSRSGPAAP